MHFLDKIKNKIKKKSLKTIVLPESEDERVLKATHQILKEKIANIILMGDEKKIRADANKYELFIDDAKIIEPKSFYDIEKYIDELFKLRKSKGLNKNEVFRIMTTKPTFFGCMMVRLGAAHALVSGSNSPTADVLRPAIQIVQKAPKINVVSSTFIMETKNKQFGDDGLLLFSDCAVLPEPNAQQLANIAISTAQTAKDLLGLEPKVAMLSFSTKGSAKHPLVSKVQDTIQILKTSNVDFKFDGEMQVDAAIIPSISQKKAPKSSIKGDANILIFPDLQSGNIGYKLVQRFGKANAYGPILQGLKKPVNDLSRGCSITDIVNLVAITVAQIK